MTKNYNKCKRLIWSTFNVEENEPLFTKITPSSGITNVFPFRATQRYRLGLLYYKTILSRSLNTMTVHIRVCSCSTQVSPWVEDLSAGGLSTCIYGMVDICNQFT